MTKTIQIDKFDFCGEAIDTSLRKVLEQTRLVDEAHIEMFAKRYHECNPSLVDSSEAVYTITFSILKLHSEVHENKQKIKKNAFILKTKQLKHGKQIPNEILDLIYDNIVASEFSYSSGWFSKFFKHSKQDQGLSYMLEQLMPAESTFSFKRILKPIPTLKIHLSLLKAKPLCLTGVRSRHAHKSSTVNAIKTAMMDRRYKEGWKKLHVILSSSQLIFTETSTWLRPVEIISLSHAVCIYDKENQFKLFTGDGQHLNLRAENESEMDDWMIKINYVATLKTAQFQPKQEVIHHLLVDLSNQIDHHILLLDRELQLRRNFMVFVPIQDVSRDRLLSFALQTGKRIETTRIDLQRLECYREFLEAELNWYTHHSLGNQQSSIESDSLDSVEIA